jgi:PTH1 family peptidyl-tRNA hydrolase
MKIVVGLGNPGRKYQLTRHNAGFMAVDALARSLRFDFDQEKYHAVIGRARMGNRDVLILKPQTFMNDSGRSVKAAMRYTSASSSGDLIVVHDELDLPLGVVRVKIGGGHGGHNGLRSIAEHLGTPEFIRVRIGIGRPPSGMDSAAFVLSLFSPAERIAAEEAVSRAAEVIAEVIADGPTRAMNRFNQK